MVQSFPKQWNKAEAKVDNFTQYSYTSITFISFTGRYEHIIDKLPTAVASYLSWLEHRTGIASSRVQLPLKSWIFFSFLRSCINCVHNCEDHSSFNFKQITLCCQPIRWVGAKVYWNAGTVYTPYYFMAESARGQDEEGRVFWLAFRKGQDGPFSRYFLRRSHKKKFSFWPYNKSFIDQACSVKIAGN